MAPCWIRYSERRGWGWGWGIVEHQIPNIEVLFKTNAKSLKHPGIKLLSSESRTQLVKQRKKNSNRHIEIAYIYIYIYILPQSFWSGTLYMISPCQRWMMAETAMIKTMADTDGNNGPLWAACSKWYVKFKIFATTLADASNWNSFSVSMFIIAFANMLLICYENRYQTINKIGFITMRKWCCNI